MNEPSARARMQKPARKRNASGNPSRYLRPRLLARLSSLELVAKAVVDGYFTGLHRSPYFGFSQEFAEYRAYNEGDDLRFIDWNVYARTDRMYIKRFHGDTNTAINLLLDISGSMRFQSTSVSKLEYAKYICASLAYLARRQHDATGMMTFDERIRERMPPASHPDTFYRLLGLLERAEPQHGTHIGACIEQLAASISKRGMVVVISDLYCDPAQLTRELQPLAQRGHDVVLLHLLDPAELEPAKQLRTLRTPATLTDLETGHEVAVSADFLAEHYPIKIRAHCAALERATSQANVDYLAVDTSQALDNVLHHYLSLRAQRR